MEPLKLIKRLQLLGTGNFGLLNTRFAVALCGAFLTGCVSPSIEPDQVPADPRAGWRPLPQAQGELLPVSAAVERRLALDRRLAGLPLGVTVDGGRVELAGVVPSHEARQIIDRAVTDVVGVERVINRTVVRVDDWSAPAHESRVDDTVVTAAVGEVLALSRRLQRHRIRASVRSGVVRLQGIVPTEGVRIYAEEVIRQVPGVKSVRNGLLVQPLELG